jgi:antagonist of KipI
MTLEILDGGLLTTVQDRGRPESTHLGVPESGACDGRSLAVANLLVGNPAEAAALEATLVGPTIAVHAPTTLGLAGADLGARIRGGRRLLAGRSHRLAPGEVVELPGDAAGTADEGARAYLAFPGGLDVPLVLGSRSTCLAGGFGGHEGRPLRAGDRLALGRERAGSAPSPELIWPTPDARSGADAANGGGDPRRLLRAIPSSTDDGGLAELARSQWRVSPAADRVGVRLDPVDGLPPAHLGGEVLTHGVPWGAIQVPPDGRPIVLGADHQTTGGYRLVGVVIAADLPVLGQLRAGSEVRLAVVDPAAALGALRSARDELLLGLAALREAVAVHGLVDAAGG